MMLQRIILSLGLLLVLLTVATVLSNLFTRSSVDDIDTRPEKYRPRFPTK